ncbi:S-adenosyl-L-methionine-dependent methyltransferase [Aspergillus varians]
MARLLRSLQQFLRLSPSSSLLPSTRFRQSIDTDFSRFREGDHVLLFATRKKPPVLAGPLQEGRKTQTPRGHLEHDQVIGRGVRDLVTTHNGSKCRAILPTIDQYVALTPRFVTPIYARDASVIVSQLNIDVAPPGEGDDSKPPLEILESGTGHGSLTLHLSRAVQAANSAPPPIPKKSQLKYLQDRPARSGNTTKDTSAPPQNAPESGEKEIDPVQQQWDAWRAQRKAIVHTVEVSPTYAKHAEKIVRGYRRGIYAGNVDFYAGRVESWIAARKQQHAPPTSPVISLFKSKSFEPFLTHAILDMPSAHLRIPHVAPILKPDGNLVVFTPSVTQIVDCVEIIRKQRIPLDLDNVIEIGTGLSGGRIWDVRFATKKSKADPGWDSSLSTDGESGTATGEPSGEGGVREETQTQTQEPAQEPPQGLEDVVVCRPKAGTLNSGGGFVAIWTKMRIAEETTQ